MRTSEVQARGLGPGFGVEVLVFRGLGGLGFWVQGFRGLGGLGFGV